MSTDSRAAAGPTPTRQEIRAQLTRLAADLAGVPLESVSPGSDLSDDLNMDSLTRIEFAMAAEEAFGVELPDERSDDIRTVEQAVDLVADALAGQPTR